LTHGVPYLVGEDAATEWFKQAHRAAILAAFDELAHLPAEATRGPRLIYSHILLPHHPVVFARDGTLPDSGPCLWGLCDLPETLPDSVRAAFRGQVEFTNDRVLELSRHILATTRRPAVIVFFSDHGFRHWMSTRAETFRSLLVAYTPGHPDLMPSDSSPVSLIPRILNAYAEEGLPLARDDVWITVPRDGSSFFPMQRLDREPPS
jgi:hypothetical protein